MGGVMTKYPEDLMQKLLDAVLDKPAPSIPSLVLYSSDNEDDILDARNVITQVLDALGLREEFSALYVTDAGTVGSRDQARRRYVTEWEEI